ncbi:MAG TPA: hypothetical protein VIF64_08915 [Pyrinomonadaceae bacterium]
MRKLTLVWLFACFMFLVPSTVTAQLSRFQGLWINSDSSNRGVTRLQISTGPPVRVRAWGECHPSDCDWGTVDGYAYGPNINSNLTSSTQTISAVFRSDFSERIVVIRSPGRGSLEADVYTRFTDNSGRTAYASRYSFGSVRRGVTTIIGVPDRRDCLPYNPRNLRIENEGASGWLLTDGRSRMLVLDSRPDAARALALARQHRAHCFIGRENQRPNRKDYIMEYWTGASGIPTTISSEDCLSYDVGGLQIRDEGANGWLLTDGRSRMVMLDNRADAEQALEIARRSSAHCFIGRDNTRTNRKDYIVEYWR